MVAANSSFSEGYRVGDKRKEVVNKGRVKWHPRENGGDQDTETKKLIHEQNEAGTNKKVGMVMIVSKLTQCVVFANTEL